MSIFLKIIFFLIFIIFIIIIDNIYSHDIKPFLNTHLFKIAKINNWSAEDTGMIGGMMHGVFYASIIGFPLFYVIRRLFYKKTTKSKKQKPRDESSHSNNTERDKEIDISYEKQFFKAANEEFSSGNVDDGIWSISFARSDGNSEKAQAIYIRLRAEELKKSFERDESEKFLEERDKIIKLEKERKIRHLIVAIALIIGFILWLSLFF